MMQKILYLLIYYRRKKKIELLPTVTMREYSDARRAKFAPRYGCNFTRYAIKALRKSRHPVELAINYGCESRPDCVIEPVPAPFAIALRANYRASAS